MATKKKQPDPVPADDAGSSSELLKKGQLGRYQLKKKLGAGGMGAVYLALDVPLNRLVALKILPPEKAENPILVKRFKAEAQAVAQLTDDNIVRVYESGEVDGYQYIALEYVEGTDVHRLIKKRGRLPVRRATEIIAQVTLALDHAHRAGIVHRDIKPANLLITQAGLVKLTDLGLARVLDDNEQTSITRAGTTVGTVDYMSPEQARSSKSADVRSDIYSLGCTWYHMLTGTPPFPEGSVTNKLHAHATARIPDPREYNDTVPESIVGVIQRMMAKKPDDRYQNPTELLEDLKMVKSSRKEISAGDLAALASEMDAESVPANANSGRRGAGSGRGDDDGHDSGRGSGVASGISNGHSSTAGGKKGGKDRNGSSVDIIPPREKRTLSDSDIPEKKQFNTEPFIYAGLALGLIAIVGLAGYVLSGVGRAIDRSDERQVNLMEQAQLQQEERATEQAGAGAQNSEAVASQEGGNDPQRSPRPQDSPNRQPPREVVPVNYGRGIVAEQMKAASTEKWPTIKIVDRSVTSDSSSVHAFHEVLEKTLADKFIIELHTTDLLRWDQPVVFDGKTVIIRAAAETSGNILIDSTGALAEGLITVRKGELVLQGLHFGLLGYELPGDTPATLIKAINAGVSVRDCSFTFEETRAAPVTLCDFTQTTGGTLRCHWEQSVVRGSLWRPFVITASRLKFLMQGCFLLIGSEPVFVLDHQGSPGVSPPSGTIDFSQRELAIADSCLVSTGTPIQVRNSRSDLNVPPTQFRINRGLFVAGAETGNAPFLEISSWPENVLGTAGTSKLSFLNWISEETAFSGWTSRLDATTNKTRAEFSVRNDEQWQEFWGNAGLSGTWNAGKMKRLSPAEMAAADPANLTQFGLTALARPEPTTQKLLDEIPLPTLSEPNWRTTLARRNLSVSVGPNPFAGSPVRLKVDLNKVDLGEFLAGQQLPAVAIVEARGFGLRTCTPIRISGSKVKIEFTSEPGKAYLTLRPTAAKADTSGQSVPWIQVTNGALALERGVFRVDPAGKSPMPSSWIAAQDSPLDLTRCYVVAPAAPHGSLESLVRVRSGNPTAQSPVALDHCYLNYGGPILDVDLQGATLKAVDSVFVSQNQAITLRHAGGAGRPAGVAELRNNTLSARLGAIHLDVAKAPPHSRPLVNAYVTQCAFVPPVDIENSKLVPQVVTTGGPMAELPARVWWWGTRNGFAPEVAQAFNNQKLDQNWPTFWGPGHVHDPLFGAEGVLLKAGRVDAKNVKPSSFTLYEDCQAVRWGTGKSRIGAPCDQLDIAIEDGKSETPTGTPGLPNGPIRVVPRF